MEYPGRHRIFVVVGKKVEAFDKDWHEMSEEEKDYVRKQHEQFVSEKGVRHQTKGDEVQKYTYMSEEWWKEL